MVIIHNTLLTAGASIIRNSEIAKIKANKIKRF